MTTMVNELPQNPVLMIHSISRSPIVSVSIKSNSRNQRLGVTFRQDERASQIIHS